ncbi:coat protein [ssRNA phage SRR7976310_12]|uniref:Coat protein n=1 Tax=ssRNA phage SRR7976310_12 TaxID=2786674 RepID=A0A8S5L212_9VIRU|nr:coat protein [ssRNA phage SRR7976310_12]DAD51154.1 TPA_asm: coat protein [ssRNA phage SRR7976310_12]
MAITLNTKVYNWGQFDKNGVGQYLETSSGIPTGFSQLTAKVNGDSVGKSRKVKWRLIIPHITIVDTAFAPAGTLLGVDYINLDADLAATGSLADRQDSRLRLAGLVTNAQFISAWDNFVQPSS